MIDSWFVADQLSMTDWTNWIRPAMEFVVSVVETISGCRNRFPWLRQRRNYILETSSDLISRMCFHSRNTNSNGFEYLPAQRKADKDGKLIKCYIRNSTEPFDWDLKGSFEIPRLRSTAERELKERTAWSITNTFIIELL